MSEISLSAGIRSNLLSLQNTSSLLSRTQERLGTGRKVNSAIDNPANYFTSVALKARASDLTARLDGISKGIQTVKAADAAVTGIKNLLSQLKGMANDILGTSSSTERSNSFGRFNELARQITELSEDAGYDGVNLLAGGTLTVQFGQAAGDSTLALTGFTGTSSGLSISALAATSDAALNTAIVAIETADNYLRSQSRQLSSNLAVLTARESFTKDMSNVLTAGADKLTLADTNEEAANLLALNTQQQLGVNALSLASQASQSVLRLLG